MVKFWISTVNYVTGQMWSNLYQPIISTFLFWCHSREVAHTVGYPLCREERAVSVPKAAGQRRVVSPSLAFGRVYNSRVGGPYFPCFRCFSCLGLFEPVRHVCGLVPRARNNYLRTYIASPMQAPHSLSHSVRTIIFLARA